MSHIDEYVDEIGQVIIKDLCALKKKFDKKERELKFFKGLLWIAIILFLAYLIIHTVFPYRYHYEQMVSTLINNVYHYLFIAVIITLYYRLKYIDTKTEKAEKEYHALRCEVIQRTEELWPDREKREKRHLVFQELKEKYNINLYYENE